MACRKYTVTVTTPDRPGLVTYVDCNFVTQSRVFRQGSTNEIFAESISARGNNVTVIADSTDTGGSGGGTPPTQVRYYQLVPCNNQPVTVYTTIPPNRPNERVSISNASDVGVPSNVFFTYNNQSTTSSNPGVIAISVFSTGATGCVDTPIDTGGGSGGGGGIDIGGGGGSGGGGSSSNFYQLSRCDDPSALGVTGRSSSDSLNIGTVFRIDGVCWTVVSRGASSGFYNLDSLSNFIDCAECNQPPPQDEEPPQDNEVYYILRGCNNPNILRSTKIPSTIFQERVLVGSVPYIYTGDSVISRAEVERISAPEVQITKTNQSGCQITPDDVLPEYYALKVCIFQEYQRPQYGNVTLYTTRRPEYEREQVTITNPKDTKKQYGVEVPADWFWYYENKPPSNKYGILAKGIQSTGRRGCPGGDSGGGDTPPDKEPTSVQCSFSELITPSLQSAFNALCTTNNLDNSEFEAGEILLNGVAIGYGNATATLEIGKSYTVEFRKPTHPQFTFSEGSPSRYTFTATKTTISVQSTFKPTFISNVGTLTVNTSIVPSTTSRPQPVSIYITGIGKVGENSLINYKLEPGEYTVYFDPIKVEGAIYQTPQKQKVVIRKCQTTTINAVYSGIPLPTNYWLKEIDGSEQLEYNSIITKGMFSNDVANLTSFYTSSISDSLDNHYTHIYESPINSITSSIQFSVAYGHSDGSGSNDEGGQYNDTPTRAIYGQYRNIILGDATSNLNLSGTPTKHFYAISYQKDRRDTKADYNALEINLAHLSGSEFIATSDMRNHTGSNVTLGGLGKVLRLISDSKINDEPQRVVPSAPIEYNIVSGSIEDGVYNQASPHYYGKLYPSLGVVLLDANKLDVSASFGTVTTREVDGKNQLKIFTAISGAAQYTDASGDFLGMKARATKEEIIYYYHINVRNKEFNYTNNPTLYNTQGLQFLQYGVPSNVRISKDFFDNTANIVEDNRAKPKTYITTIGLYDIDRNLIAVAKLSKAEFKSFTDEVMFTVKLKF